MWNSIFYFVMVPMVYIAFATLAGGLLFKLAAVAASPGMRGTLGAYPRKLPRPLGVLKDSLLAPAALRRDPVFWVFVASYHLAFLLLFIGHLELVREFKPLQVIPHDVFLGRGAVGIVLIVAVLYFLFRRFRPPYSTISVPEDYILLLLLFLTMFFGSHMNLASRSSSGFDISVDVYRQYLSSLVALKPRLPDGLTMSPHYVLVVLHVFFANLVLMLFPFTKMIHSLLVFVSHNIRRR